jgi:cytochrome c-type biogenesis protein CcmH/NrfG
MAEGETTASAMPAWVAQTLCPESSSGGAASTVTDSSSTLTASNDYLDAIAKLIADVADGLDYAHTHGVIHRDMKPSNLLLSPDGRLSINDFGLARMLEQPGMTTTGEFMGSPLYMSPEQIAVGRAPLDHRTDIYSLGATLYELLTLAPPFMGERRDQVIAQIMHKEPKPPRRINAKIPVDLETICLKALDKDPDRRYQTAGHMAEDLRRFVNRFAISAKRAGVIGRTGKWVRRHPTVAVSLLIALLAVATAGSLAYRQRFVERQLSLVKLDRAKEGALLHAMSGDFARAESAIREAEMLDASAGWVRMLRGQVALHQLQPSAAVEHLNQAVRLLPESVAANAMLSLALMHGGQWNQSFVTLQQFETLTPKTAEDYLFLGWAQSSIVDASAGLPALDEAVRLRPGSPMVRVVRAKMRAFSAVDSGDSELIELALADAITAKGMLPDSVAAIESHLYAHLVAINHYEENHDDAKRSAALEIAQKDAQELGRFSGRPGAHFQRAKYFEYLGREQDVLDEWRVASTGEFASDEVFRQYAFALYRCTAMAILTKHLKSRTNCAHEAIAGRANSRGHGFYC